MIVLDNSFFMAALLENEQNPFAISLYKIVLEGEETVKVPAIFLYEAYNVILSAFRHKRISKTAKNDYLQLIHGFPMQVDNNQPMLDVAEIAAKQGLTIYDAAYLELAKRESLPLATFDNALIIAAKKENISLISNIVN